MNYPTIQHRWFDQVWNQGRAEVIDELLAEDVLGHGLVDTGGNEVRGTDQFKSFYHSFRSAFPDVRISVEETVTEGDRIVARCKVTGTHTGDGLGIAPTNRAVTFEGMCMARVRDGKVVESWNHFDFLSLFQQLGAVQLGAAAVAGENQPR